jgi:hypothetical protein
MSKSTDKDIEKYVADLMPPKVKKALRIAQESLYSGEGDWVKNSKIVNDWWNENMRADLVVDDGGNVSTEYEWDRFVEKAVKEMYKEAKKQALAEGIDDEEEQSTEYGYVTEAEYAAQQSADHEGQNMNEVATRYNARDVKRLVLGRDWS